MTSWSLLSSGGKTDNKKEKYQVILLEGVSAMMKTEVREGARQRATF